MFTGIIETTGKVANLEQKGGDWTLHISSEQMDFSDVAIGDSIAVSGVCLTVVKLNGKGFEADVSNETMSCTSLEQLQSGSLVNLEKAMQPSTRFGGHIVSGHVDGLAELLAINNDGRSLRLQYLAPETLGRYIAAKGSVCLDGVSLTVNEVEGNEFGVNIIPHTAERTTIHQYRAGRKVNLEVDVISRYLERLIEQRSDAATGSISHELLKEHGFTR